MEDKRQSCHFSRDRLAPKLHVNALSRLAQGDRQVAHRNVLFERRREGAAGHRTNLVTCLEDGETRPRHAASRHPQADKPPAWTFLLQALES